ncbi:photosystem II stability assembly factor chloroplastic [Raphidocelis subcapitata]|uniref:Photosystem II stability/assembly factor n=1 Tax=Raphidocelis subcapitata TaxID=307507 RepID=A0A2V0NNI2_9CHLO|nr:photosystem II stability assembly factor chloroplastic [Raphidocelis subcapitata]|eukprot:GBF88779.1 photosystem II stability assembly factor chloroplastic [Raphidocelis subcapitata]
MQLAQRAAPASGAAASKARKAFRPAKSCSVVVRAQNAASSGEATTRRSLLGASVALSAAAGVLPQLALPGGARANTVLSADWEQVKLPVDDAVVLLDIGFCGDDPNHGFLLGTRQTLLETLDGGKTWEPRTIEAARDEGFNYRFNSVSFSGSEGWIVGKPAILLHTADSGKNWERIPLSNKLPGTPLLVSALGNGGAEMTTDQGAIYVTDNTAYSWTAAVQETVDATLNRTVSSGISGASYYEGSFSNVARSARGDYVAVSSRGNFFMTWTPGQTYWQPHNRPTARRVQNMGFTAAGDALWMSTRGGDVYLSADAEGNGFDTTKLSSRGFGVLDVGYATPDIAFACGGSGSLFKSMDGGKTWKRDKSTDGVAGNLYSIHFFPGNNGFILGNSGILLKYIGGTA